MFFAKVVFMPKARGQSAYTKHFCVYGRHFIQKNEKTHILLPKLKEQTMKVVISTSMVNSYGSRVLTEGIDYSQYEKNPIVLWMHSRPWGESEDEILPIGKMSGIKQEGDKLVGDIEFDQDDEFACKIEKKYAKGILNMVSAGLDVLELSDKPEDLLAGQTRMTISKSKLRETSCVDIGANDESLCLSMSGKSIDRKDIKEIDNFLPLLTKREDKQEQLKKMEMNEILKKLNLKESSSETEVINAIVSLQEKACKGEEMEKIFLADKTKRIKTLVEQALSEKKITPDKREMFEKVGLTNGLEVLEACLTGMSGKVPDVTEEINKGKKENLAIDAKTWDKMDKEGSLYELKMKDETLFEQLFEAKFGKKKQSK